MSVSDQLTVTDYCVCRISDLQEGSAKINPVCPGQSNVQSPVKTQISEELVYIRNSSLILKKQTNKKTSHVYLHPVICIQFSLFLQPTCLRIFFLSVYYLHQGGYVAIGILLSLCSLKVQILVLMKLNYTRGVSCLGAFILVKESFRIH